MAKSVVLTPVAPASEGFFVTTAQRARLVYEGAQTPDVVKGWRSVSDRVIAAAKAQDAADVAAMEERLLARILAR